MRVLQGGILAPGVMIAAIGATGLLSALLHTISPITVAANIAIVGLSLFNVGWNGGVGNCPAWSARHCPHHPLQPVPAKMTSGGSHKRATALTLQLQTTPLSSTMTVM